MTEKTKKLKKQTIKFINVTCDKPVDNAVLKADRYRTCHLFLKKKLCEALNSNGMNVKVHLYGSRIIGIAHKGSDMDIFIEYGDNFYSDKNVERDQEVLKKVATVIERMKGWEVKVMILGASTPIIQACYRPCNLQCDVSVSNGLGVANSLMLAYLFDLQPEAKKFYHFINIFLKRYEKCVEGYLLKLLVTFFFQHKNVFPSVEMVQKNLLFRYIDGWPTAEINNVRNISYSYYGLNSMAPYKSYIPRFFEFYSNFEYSKYVMSTYEGKQLDRSNYEYKEEIKDHTLCIFGPLNRSNNIGKYLSKGKSDCFINICKTLNDQFIANAQKLNFY